MTATTRTGSIRSGPVCSTSEWANSSTPKDEFGGLRPPPGGRRRAIARRYPHFHWAKSGEYPGPEEA